MAVNKWFELSSLHGCGGCYTAVLYNRCCMYYKEIIFSGYSKRDIYRKLRREYGCIVSRDFN